jgi:hypothetical protein
VKALKDQIKKMNKGGLANFVWMELLKCLWLHGFGEAGLLLELAHNGRKGIKGRGIRQSKIRFIERLLEGQLLKLRDCRVLSDH